MYLKNSISFIFLLFLLHLTGCDSLQKSGDTDISKGEKEITELEFDSARAAEYGADEYGMKKYVMAFLKRGPNRSQDSVTAANLQRAHLQNIQKLAGEGKLVLAGPFFGDGDLRGIYVFNVSSIEEAEKLTKTDPAIQAGSLTMDLIEWYGPAGLHAVNEINETLTKKKIVNAE